jgi:hypothetical protein
MMNLGPNAPVETAPNGAKQSATPCRADLLPPAALLHIGAILKGGAEKYGEENWRGLTLRDHINHAYVHILAFLDGDTQDDHLGHAACRMLFALETHLKQSENVNPKAKARKPTLSREGKRTTLLANGWKQSGEYYVNETHYPDKGIPLEEAFKLLDANYPPLD